MACLRGGGVIAAVEDPAAGAKGFAVKVYGRPDTPIGPCAVCCAILFPYKMLKLSPSAGAVVNAVNVSLPLETAVAVMSVA